MKKVLAFLMAMIMLLAIVACGEDGTDPVDGSTDATTEGTVDTGKEDALDIWNGVEGDEFEVTLTAGGSELKVMLNRDGSCYAYSNYVNTVTGADYNHPELDAELAAFPTYYGSYEAKEGEVILTLDAQVYYRIVAWGKDADAFKDVYFEGNFSEEYREGYYGKGIIRSEEKGTLVYVSNYDGNILTIVSATVYDENNNKTSFSVVNADGSFKNTLYYPDGTVAEIGDYDADGTLVKRENYDESGALQYIEKTVKEGDRSVKTCTDAEGNLIRTEERKYKKYENGGYYSEVTTIENDITVYHNIVDEKCDAEGINISSYSLLESIEGNRKIYNVYYTDYKDATNNYTFSRETVDGVLTYYYCAVEKVTVMEGVKGRQHVSYSLDTGLYSLSVEYIDENGNLIGRGYDYPANEYVHGEWETFEYVIE